MAQKYCYHRRATTPATESAAASPAPDRPRARRHSIRLVACVIGHLQECDPRFCRPPKAVKSTAGAICKRFFAGFMIGACAERLAHEETCSFEGIVGRLRSSWPGPRLERWQWVRFGRHCDRRNIAYWSVTDSRPGSAAFGLPRRPRQQKLQA